MIKVDVKAGEAKLEASPLFYRGERYAPVAELSVAVNGKILGTYMLRINGVTGALSLINRTATVEPPLLKEALDAAASKAVPGNAKPDPK